MNSTASTPCVRADGHVLLLIESAPGHRTFSDYPAIRSCLDTIITMYEEYRDEFNENLGGDLMDFCKWLDDLHNIKLFEYDRDIGRYKHINREGLKQLFETNDGSSRNNELTKSIDSTANCLNGFSLNGKGRFQESDSDDTDDWDD